MRMVSYVGREVPEQALERVSFSLFEEESATGLQACNGSHANRPWARTVRSIVQDSQLN